MDKVPVQTLQSIRFASSSGEYTGGNEKVHQPCGRDAKCVCNYQLSCQNAAINKQTCLEKLQSSVSAIFWHFIARVSFFHAHEN